MKTRGKYGTSSAYDRFYAYDEKPKTVRISSLSGGVCTREVSDHAVASLMNMESDGDTLVSIASPAEELFEEGFANGKIQYHCYADGVWLFRKGHSLYARIGECLMLVGERDMLMKEEGMIYDLDGCFYVIDGERILSVARDLSFSQVEQQVPVCLTEVSRDGQSYTKSHEPNPFQRYVDIILASGGGSFQVLPSAVIFDEENITVFLPNSEEILSPARYTLAGNSIQFADINPAGCRIRLRLLDSADTTKISFSSTADSRAFLSSECIFLPYYENRERYFLTWQGREILLIPCGAEFFASFSEENILHIPMSESISAVIAYSDGHLVITEHSVKKLYFTKNDEHILCAQTEILKSDFGSDMPGSICGFDDKIVFASSKGGIFYVNQFGITEKDVGRKISANIEDGEFGFFSHTEEEFRAAKSGCAFGKYYLTIGEITYIWDYEEKLPSVTQSLIDEKKMVWSLSNHFAHMNVLQFLAGKLYLWDTKNNKLCFFEDKRKIDRDETVFFMTSPFDLGTETLKIITEIGIRYQSSAPLTIKLFLDGKETTVSYRLPKHDAMTTAFLRPYPKPCEKIAVFVCAEGNLTAESLCFRYI